MLIKVQQIGLQHDVVNGVKQSMFSIKILIIKMIYIICSFFFNGLPFKN